MYLFSSNSIFQGGQYTPLANYPSLVPNGAPGYPYSYKTSGSSDNIFLGKNDVVQLVLYWYMFLSWIQMYLLYNVLKIVE